MYLQLKISLFFSILYLFKGIVFLVCLIAPLHFQVISSALSI